MSILKGAVAAALTAATALSGAHAAFIDMADYIDNVAGEQALFDGSTDVHTVAGIKLRFDSNIGWAYFDRGNAGVGVCSQGLKGTNMDQCNPGSDDNVTAGEELIMEFVDEPHAIYDLVFRDANHNLLTSGLIDFTVTRGGNVQSFTWDIADPNYNKLDRALDSIAFAYNNVQFYLSAAEAVPGNQLATPVPAAAFLFAPALAGLAMRRKKA